MSRTPPTLTVVGGNDAAPSGDVGLVSAPSIPPNIKLTAREKKLWQYILDSLAEAGIEHVTAGLPIAIIVRTYSDWLKSAALCEEKGRHQTGKTGWSVEAPWAADERRLKADLGQWLPKACLTIPSLTRVKKDMGVGTGQDDLFADLVGHANSRPTG